MTGFVVFILILWCLDQGDDITKLKRRVAELEDKE